MVPEKKERKAVSNSGEGLPEVRQIVSALVENDYNVSVAAKQLGLSRRGLYNKMEPFIPDCAIAQSWQRLAEGQEKDIKPHDRTLIKHEMLEMKIKRENPGIDHTKAHEIASAEYNYSKASEAYYDSLTKRKKNR